MACCKVCSKIAPVQKSSCLCGTIYCSKECQKSEFAEHKLTCLTLGFGLSGHYAFFLDKMSDVSDELKSLWKTINMEFLETIQKLKRGEKVGGKDLSAVWIPYKKHVKLLPKHLKKRFPNKPTLEDSTGMLSTVLRTIAKSGKTGTQCSVCFEDFAEPGKLELFIAFPYLIVHRKSFVC